MEERRRKGPGEKDNKKKDKGGKMQISKGTAEKHNEQSETAKEVTELWKQFFTRMICSRKKPSQQGGAGQQQKAEGNKKSESYKFGPVKEDDKTPEGTSLSDIPTEKDPLRDKSIQRKLLPAHVLARGMHTAVEGE